MFNIFGTGLAGEVSLDYQRGDAPCDAVFDQCDFAHIVPFFPSSTWFGDFVRRSIPTLSTSLATFI